MFPPKETKLEAFEVEHLNNFFHPYYFYGPLLFILNLQGKKKSIKKKSKTHKCGLVDSKSRHLNRSQMCRVKFIILNHLIHTRVLSLTRQDKANSIQQHSSVFLLLFAS